jgi:hypothetical protein
MSRKHTDRGVVGRRWFLRSAGLATAGAVAGCSGGGSRDTETATNTQAGTTDPTATATATKAAYDIEALEASVTDVAFEGEFFDTHVHWHGARDTRHDILDPGTLAAEFGEEGVGATALFTASTEVTAEYGAVLEEMDSAGTDFLPFLEPYDDDLLEGNVTDVYAQHPEVFHGIGEIIFYGGAFKRTSLTADPWPKLFEFSASEDIPLMIHPTLTQESGLKTMLSRYPNATVLAHGGEYNLKQDVLEPILADNENLYWTLDAGSMLNGLVLRAADAEEFAATYDERKSDFHNLVKSTLPWMMEAAPERVCWGTDLATDWNTDPKVISRVMDWTQAALDSLPETQREQYAYKNARELFDI